MAITGSRLVDWNTVWEVDRELLQRFLPVLDRHCPLFAGVVQRQVEQLEDCFVAGEKVGAAQEFPIQDDNDVK